MDSNCIREGRGDGPIMSSSVVKSYVSGREGENERGMEGVTEGGRDRGKEGGRKREREKKREGGREGERNMRECVKEGRRQGVSFNFNLPTQDRASRASAVRPAMARPISFQQ